MRWSVAHIILCCLKAPGTKWGIRAGLGVDGPGKRSDILDPLRDEGRGANPGSRGPSDICSRRTGDLDREAGAMGA